MWVTRSNQPIDYREELLDRLHSIPTHRETSYKKFVNYIEQTLLDYDDPDVIEMQCYIGNDYYNADIMISGGFFSFVAYRQPTENIGRPAWEMTFKHSYLPHEKVLQYSSRLSESKFEHGLVNAISDQWRTEINNSVRALRIRARRMITVEEVLSNLRINELTLHTHIQNLIQSVDAFLDTNIEDQMQSLYNQIQHEINKYDWDDFYPSTPHHYPTHNTEKPKERVPVSGYIYIVKSTDLNLYGFRKSTSDIDPNLHAQLNFSNQKYPLETISYFKSNDTNKMFRVVKKKFDSKKVDNYNAGITFEKWDFLSQSNWYDLSVDDISEITNGNFSEVMQEELTQSEMKKNEFLSPGGYLVLFRDEFNAYHLRSTAKANPQNLIWRGSHEYTKPVIGFLTKDLEKLRGYFHNTFRDKRDFSGNGNKEKYLFNEEEIEQRIRPMALNETLQIVEVINPRSDRGSVVFETTPVSELGPKIVS
ncbi:hypothetical protein [Cohnella soli]|uniref:GIY-YIG nuclease family protein n=1 Tax=Cohnella soli TaxID=425005 RepID=A0ABW0HQB7_9BACL